MFAMPNDLGTRREDDRQSVCDCFAQIRTSISVTPGGGPHTTVEEEPGQISEPRKETVVGGASPDRFNSQHRVPPGPCPGPLAFRLATLASTPGGPTATNSAAHHSPKVMTIYYLITLERPVG